MEWFTCSFSVTVFKILLPQELLVEVSLCIVLQKIFLLQEDFIVTEVAMKSCHTWGLRKKVKGRVVIRYVVGLRSR